MSSERLERLTHVMDGYLDDGKLAGAVVLIARHGHVAYFRAFGESDREAKKAMREDSIFRIYSMTKPIVSVGIMMLVEQGRINLSDPVSKHIAELKGLRVGVEKDGRLDLVPAQREATVQDLLRHTSGLTYGIFGKPSLIKQQYNAAKLFDRNQSNAEFAAKIAKLPLHYQPGATWDYSMSTDVLGRVVEVASGMELQDFLVKRILAPLGMNDTAFWLGDPGKKMRIAEAQADPASGKRPPLFDPMTKAWQSGGGGLVSTAGDYARFSQMLLNGGELDGVRILSRKSVDLMTSDHIPKGIAINHLADPAADVRPEVGNGFGLGFMVRVADGKSALPGTVGDYGWGGAFGTYYWADPKRGLFAIAMLQTPGPAAGPLRAKYRAEMRKLVYKALVN